MALSGMALPEGPNLGNSERFAGGRQGGEWWLADRGLRPGERSPATIRAKASLRRESRRPLSLRSRAKSAVSHGFTLSACGTQARAGFEPAYSAKTHLGLKSLVISARARIGR